MRKINNKFIVNSVKDILSLHGLFTIIALFFGTAFLLITPLFWGVDENGHFFRSYHLSGGNISVEAVDTGSENIERGGYLPVYFRTLMLAANADFFDNNPSSTHQIDNGPIYEYVKEQQIKRDTETVPIGFAGTMIYPPYVYIGPVAGIFFANLVSSNVESMILFARFFNLIIFIIFSAISLYLLRNSSFKWLVFIVATLPMVLFQASIINPDGFIFGIIFILFAQLVILIKRKEPSWKFIITFGITAVILSISKLSYALLLLILPFIMMETISKRKRFAIKVGVPIVALLLAVIWYVTIGRYIAGPGGEEISGVSQIIWIIQHPLHYASTIFMSINTFDWIAQSIGSLGSTFVYIPKVLLYVAIMVLTATFFIREVNTESSVLSYRNSVLFIAAGITVNLAVITILYMTWNKIGGALIEGVQGRYFIPGILFILAGVVGLVRIKMELSRRTLTIACSAFSILMLTASILWYYKVVY